MPVGRLMISFIVPVRNDAVRLGKCLEAIRRNDCDPQEVEIVVADNGSVDESPDVARSAGATGLDLPGHRVTALRNIGAGRATADVLAFCDADNLIGPAWVGIVHSLFEDPRVAAVGTSYSPPEPCTWVQHAYDGLRDHSPGTRSTRWLGAGNMAVRRSAFEEVGGFDESLETCEDVDLCNRLRTAGWMLLSDSRLSNVHLGDPETLNEVFWGELWRGRNNLKVSLRGKPSWRDLPSIALPVVNLGLLGAASVGLLAAPFGGLALFGIAISGSIGLAVMRALRMLQLSDRLGWRQVPQAFAVAGIYELARALALIWTVDHHRNRKA